MNAGSVNAARASVIRKPLVQVANHVGEDVEAGEIERAERGALRPADRRAGDLVDLLNRVGPLLEAGEDPENAVQREVVADEAWRVLGDDDAFAERAIGEGGDRVQHGAVRVGRRDHFEQVQISRRVEEVRAEPVTTEVVAAALGDGGDRNG